MRLCLALGFPTRRALLQMMTREDIAEWEAYEAIEGPIGQRHDDALFGRLIAATIMPHAKEGADMGELGEAVMAVGQALGMRWHDPTGSDKPDKKADGGDLFAALATAFGAKP